MAQESGPRPSVRVRSAAWIFSAQAFSLLLSLPTSILLARVLGAEGKGVLSVIQMIASFSAVVLNFGIGQAFVYYSARRQVRGRDAVWLSVGFGSLIAGALTGLALLLGEQLANLLNVSPAILLLVGFAATGPVLMSQFLNAHVVGRGDIRVASLVNVGLLAFQLLASLILALLGMLTAQAAVAVWAAGVTGVTVVFAAMAWGSQPTVGVATGVRPLLRRMWRYGIAAWPGGILGTASQRIDVLMLASLRGPAEVGIYSIAVTLAELALYIPNALGGVLLPKVAAEGEDSLQISLRLSRTTWMLTAAAAVMIAGFAPLVVPLLFGSDFRASIPPLYAILPGIIVMSMSSSMGAYLTGRGKPVYGTVAALINVMVNVPANWLLVPAFGPVGASLASTISYTAATAFILVVFVRTSRATLREALVPTREDLSALSAAAMRAVLSWRRTG